MGHLACVSLSAFPLQLLCRRFPEWKELPAAVVSEEKPQSPILWVNEQARKKGVLPGQKFSYGLSLTRDLRARTVSREEMEEAELVVAKALRRHSPDIDRSSNESGVFWVNGAGLEKLYTSKDQWADELISSVEDVGFQAKVVVGYSRFNTYAVSQTVLSQKKVFASSEEEFQWVHGVPLDRLNIQNKVRDSLAKLDVTTVGSFLCLPEGGVLARYGRRAFELQQLAKGQTWEPLQLDKEEEVFEKRILFDEPVENVGRIMFAVKRGVDDLLARLVAKKLSLEALWVRLVLDRREGAEVSLVEICVRPVEPTLDCGKVLRLATIRLNATPLERGVVEVFLRVDSARASREQLRLFVENPARNLRAANEAIEKIRAELGDDAVVFATVDEGHLPEANFSWKRVDRVRLPEVSGGKPNALVRRIARPTKLFYDAKYDENGSSIWAEKGVSLERVHGPYVIAGGWWNRELFREYYFVETEAGQSWWVFYDRKRKHWYLQGEVQ